MVRSRKNRSFLFTLIILMVYSILKIYRNTMNFYDTSQGGIWNIILLFLIAMSLFEMFLGGVRINRKILVLYFAYILIIYLNGIISLNGFSVSNIYAMIAMPSFAYIVILSYCTAVKGYEEKYLNYFVYFWIPTLIFIFYCLYTFYGNYYYKDSGGKLALNISYYALSLIPFLFLIKKRKLSFAMILLSIVIIFISNKRAGLIALILGFCGYYLVNQMFESNPGRKIKRFFIAVLLIIVVGFACVKIDTYYSLGIFNRLSKVFVDEGSGRIDIYLSVFDELKNASFFEVIFGHGPNSIVHIGHSSAHNDFLNVLYEYGLLPAIIMIRLYVCQFSILLRMIKEKYRWAPAYTFSLIVSIMLSLFSSNLDDQLYGLIFAFFWGIVYKDYYELKNNSGVCEYGN